MWFKTVAKKIYMIYWTPVMKDIMIIIFWTPVIIKDIMIIIIIFCGAKNKDDSNILDQQCNYCIPECLPGGKIKNLHSQMLQYHTAIYCTVNYLQNMQQKGEPFLGQSLNQRSNKTME